MPDLRNYITVRDRLLAAQSQIRSVVVQECKMLTDSVGVISVRVELVDGRFAEGSAHFRLGLEGKSAQATSPIEDAETSALGRALQWLGYYSDKPSLEEMQRAQQHAEQAERAQELREHILAVMDQIEESGHRLTEREVRGVANLDRMPVERLERALKHFEQVLSDLPS